MNIQTQVCGIVLLLVLIIFIARKKTLHLNSQIIYSYLLGTTLICLTFDILSIVFLSYKEKYQISQLLVDMVCKCYLISLVCEALGGLLYVCADVYVKQKEFIKNCLIYSSVAFIDILFIIVLPITSHVDGTVVYTEGLSVFFTYVGAVGFIVINYFMILLKKEYINSRKCFAVLMWLTLWLIAAFIQFFNNELLIVGYATVIGVTIIYLRMENPELYVDRSTGLFNLETYFDYTSRLLSQEKTFSVLAVSFYRGVHSEYDSDLQRKVLNEIAPFLMNIDSTMTFKISEDIVIMVIEEQNTIIIIDKVRKILNDTFAKYEHFLINARYEYIAHADKFNDAQDILHLLTYVEIKKAEIGQNNFRYIDEAILHQMTKESEVINKITKAIDKDLIEVYFQPIYSIKEKAITCAEALIRMYDEEGNLVMPSDFIPVAEANGLIVKLGEVVFEKVCKFLKESQIIKFGIKYIDVNLSVIQCAREDLADEYIDIIKRYGINPSWINLEITESSAMLAKQTILDNMNKLIEFGVNFSLDDFGTGQSNLNYIVEMPFDIIKFDKDMTKAYFDNRKAKYVMTAAIQMIHGMELKIVSEGIETKEQIETLVDLGIDYIQGYYFSKPLTQLQFIDYVKEKKYLSKGL